MPTISQFFGIMIRMFYRDHNPPHFHAVYAEYRASFEIKTGKVIEGEMPKTATKLINQWRELHIDELLRNWEKAREEQVPDKIEPLE